MRIVWVILVLYGFDFNKLSIGQRKLQKKKGKENVNYMQNSYLIH